MNAAVRTAVACIMPQVEPRRPSSGGAKRRHGPQPQPDAGAAAAEACAAGGGCDAAVQGADVTPGDGKPGGSPAGAAKLRSGHGSGQLEAHAAAAPPHAPATAAHPPAAGQLSRPPRLRRSSPSAVKAEPESEQQARSSALLRANMSIKREDGVAASSAAATGATVPCPPATPASPQPLPRRRLRSGAPAGIHSQSPSAMARPGAGYSTHSGRMANGVSPAHVPPAATPKVKPVRRQKAGVSPANGASSPVGGRKGKPTVASAQQRSAAADGAPQLKQKGSRKQGGAGGSGLSGSKILQQPPLPRPPAASSPAAAGAAPAQAPSPKRKRVAAQLADAANHALFAGAGMVFVCPLVPDDALHATPSPALHAEL